MTRPPILRTFDAFQGELVIDNFAGGGGASTGIVAALGRPVDMAFNHSPTAIAMHAANHPETKHFCQDIREVDPVEVCGGRPVGLAWFSPDCTHFSRAKGAQPVKKEIRALAWVVIDWARTVRPRVILLENVEEFQTWGPLLEDEPRPDPARAGETFREWLAALKALGYAVEFRSLVAADYGTPTSRKRLFLIARCDGAPIVWPETSHGRHRPEPWKPASSVIDWSIPCPSIFDRARPLAPATLARIASGVRRFVIESASPFLMPVTHQGGPSRVHSLDEPLRTVTAAHRGELGLVSPFLVRHGHYSKKSGAGLVEGMGAGLFRGQQLALPLATVCGTNDKHLVAPVLLKHFGGVVGHRVDRTLGTVTAKDHHSLAAAFLTKMYGTSTGAPVDVPMPTVTAGGGRGGGHLASVQALLIQYNGANGSPRRGQQVFEPLHTVTTKARFGLVTVHGVDYQIVDIGMRMLQPRELFSAQGFPADYNITPEFRGKPMTKTDQTSMAGNSVCCPLAEALVKANASAAPARTA